MRVVRGSSLRLDPGSGGRPRGPVAQTDGARPFPRGFGRSLDCRLFTRVRGVRFGAGVQRCSFPLQSSRRLTLLENGATKAGYLFQAGIGAASYTAIPVRVEQLGRSGRAEDPRTRERRRKQDRQRPEGGGGDPEAEARDPAAGARGCEHWNASRGSTPGESRVTPATPRPFRSAGGGACRVLRSAGSGSECVELPHRWARALRLMCVSTHLILQHLLEHRVSVSINERIHQRREKAAEEVDGFVEPRGGVQRRAHFNEDGAPVDDGDHEQMRAAGGEGLLASVC
ncbi:hypothetical protein NDU88_000164 [Pleurodeles waltl]|uniref:Uncharacterized protein n=1 Tax=Pleurodeles waltl TaxID=8319 RepID=A0AAV7P3E3_PLEWA|nr:hypothetical protein NDU88_000164 [Pleurodeles waltl]